MGLFDSLTDAFTGAPAQKAAEQQRQYLSGVQTSGNSAIQSGLAGATGAVNAGAQGGLAALGQGYGDATNATNAGADESQAYLRGGYNNSTPFYDQAREAYAPLSALGQKYGGATTLALDNLGVNGAGAQNAARSSFQAGPAYNFNLDQGINSIARLRNAQSGGNGMGGNADRDAQTYGAGLASNEYGNYMNQLLGFTNPELQATSGAASGVAGVNTAQAGAVNQLGQNQSAVAGARGSMLADLASRYGSGVAGIQTGQGNTLAGLQTGAAGQQVGLGTALAAPYSNTYGQEAAAQQQGSANLWGAALGGLKLGANVAGYGLPTVKA